ncbi:hypothetical protein UlMin_022354 [Ulmus minor]
MAFAGSHLASISILLIVLDLSIFSNAEPRTELVTRSCRDTLVQNATNYVQHYHQLAREMDSNMARDKFAFGEMGDAPDRIYLFAQCMGDLSGRECTVCYDAIRDVLSGCFPATGGRIFFGGCFIRAENYSFFDHATEPDDLRRCSDSVDFRPEFSEVGRKVINGLVKLTVDNGGFGVLYKKTTDFLFFAMANCWKILNQEMCAICLQNAAQGCLSCLPSNEGRVFNSGCSMRFSDYDFSNNPEARKEKEILLMYSTYVIGGIAISALIVIIGLYMVRSAHSKKRLQSKPNAKKGAERDLSIVKRNLQFLHFSYATLEKATECFDEAHKLGRGGYGEVFKGTLRDGREIAIKRLFVSGKKRTEEICNEMDIISGAQHKNLVRFLGCCFTVESSYLVYEFLVNKSLDCILFDSDKKRELDWKKRFQIIIGTVEGLDYLHRGCQLRIIHRDIKAGNVLLDAKFKPKIADFGLARFYSCDTSSTTISGTFGYLAPEYLAHGRLTEKVDVYSFGVLVLEIVSGVRNNHYLNETSFETLVAHAWKHFQSNTMSEIIDKTIEDEEDIKEAERIVQIGLICTQASPSLRPTMTKVRQMLKQNDVELPKPSQPPFIDEHLELSSSHRRQPSCISDLFSPRSNF